MPAVNKKKFNKYLNKHYYSAKEPGSFRRLDIFWRSIASRDDLPKGLTRGYVKEWLGHQDVTSVYRLRRVNFPRERIISPKIDHHWQSDLAVLSSLKKYNSGIANLLFSIDIFSRFLFVKGLKDKKGRSVANAFEEIFSTGRVPLRIQVDRGSEFYNKEVAKLFKSYSIHMYSTYSTKKSNYCERSIRTIKSSIFKLMYDRQSFTYIDSLDDIVYSYNNTVHSTIKVKPSSITKDNYLEFYIKHYMPYVNKASQDKSKPAFTPGSIVRISHARQAFPKSYEDQYSEAIFTVIDVLNTSPRRYKLADALGEKVKGSFYKEQLAPVKTLQDREFKIQKVLKSRNNNTEKLIRWYGYSSKYDTWLPSNQVKNYTPGVYKGGKAG